MKLSRAAVALVAVVAMGGMGVSAALAGNDPGAATYTGCLNPSSGTLSNVQAGSTPAKKCSTNETTITLGGGDLTEILTGTGLTGGGASGAVSLELAPGYRLPQDCTGQNVVAKWSGTSWDCAPDDDTTYDGGDFATSGQSCTAGQVVTGVDFAGAVTCAADKDTTYDGSDFTTSGQSCTAGKVVTGVDASGALACDSLPSAGSSVIRGTYRNGGNQFVAITQAQAEVGSVDLPTAGAWMISVTGVIANTASNILGGNERSTYCDLFSPSGAFLQRTGVDTAGHDDDGSLAIQYAGNLAAGHVSIACDTIGGAPDNTNTGILWLQVNATSLASVS